MWLGVTIAIPEPFGVELARAREAAGDPLAGVVPPHVTLLPPTQVSEDRFDDVHAMLEQITATHPEFTLGLNGTGTFLPISPVVFVALEQGWEECHHLHADLNTGILGRERDFPYHPHVTIAQNIEVGHLERAHERMADFNARFTVTSIELFEHAGGLWNELKSYRLGPA